MNTRFSLLKKFFIPLMIFFLSINLSSASTYDIFIWTTDGMLPMGGVSVTLDGETIVTEDGPMGGEAIFSGKEPGIYDYTATKNGYATVNGSVEVIDQNASDFAVMNPVYDIFIWTTDGMLPMGGVTVILDGETIVTDEGPMGGEAIFSSKLPGVYEYTASKDGYATVNGSVEVIDQNASDFAVMNPVYDIFIWTTDGMLPMGGVSVTLDEETIVTDEGPMGGEAIFSGKLPGVYEYTASKEGYVTVNGSVEVIDQNASDFAVMNPIPTYDIFIWTTDGMLPVGGVSVTLDGETIVTEEGPMGGEAIFTDKAAGIYEYTAAKEGYATVNGTVEVIDQNASDFAVMEPVFDAFFWCSLDGSPMGTEGIEVTIDDQTIVSGFDGLALFEGLTPGVYNYSASFHQYSTVNGTIEIIDQNIMEFVTLYPAPTFDAYLFTVLEGNTSGTNGVEVTVDGVSIVSQYGGVAIFEDLYAGNYEYTATYPGYVTQTGTFSIIDQNIEEVITMVPNPVYDIFIWTTNENMLPMGGVSVTIDGETIVTDNGPMGGEAVFLGKEPGIYEYTASKEGYATVNGSIEIIDQNVSAFATMLPVSTYDIFIWTTDENMLAMGGVSVTLDGETIVTEDGPMGGEAIFTGKVPGVYEFTATKEGYITVNGSVEVIDQNATAFAIMLPLPTYDIFIWTTDENMLAMGGVSVTLDGETIVTEDGPMGGEAIFTGKVPGVYEFTATKEGYVTVNSSVEVIDQNAFAFATMLPLPTYDIFIWTTDENMLAMGGVSVTLDGETIVTEDGPMGGEAIFTGKVPGVYEFTATKEGYVTVNSSVEVIDQNAFAFATMLPLPTYDIFISTTDENMLAMGGVSVTLDGETIVTEDGPMGGEAIFAGKVPGVYEFTATKEGYITVNGSVEVIDQNATAFATMIPIPLYSAFMWVSEEGNPMGLADVYVTVDGETQITDFDGLTVFEELEPGDYNYQAAKDGYITVSGIITITDQNIEEYIVMIPEIYDAFFWCSEDGNPMGLSDVNITIDGTTITSDFDGLALFENMIPGTYEYIAEKEGYETINGSIIIVDQNIEEYIVLSMETWTVQFIIDDGDNPIENAMIELNNTTEYTDNTGVAVFEDIPNGPYDYTITMDGYQVEQGSITVNDEDVIVELSLVVSSINENSLTKLEIYPNPSNGLISIEYQDNYNLKVYHQDSKILYEKYNCSAIEKFDLSDLPAGIYHIMIESNHQILNSKILITK